MNRAKGIFETLRGLSPWVIVLLVAGSAMGQPKPAAPPALPADLNQASMRVSALDTLYEFDLSPEQLKALRAAAAKTAAAQPRTAAKANAELAQAFRDFQAALLAGSDDAAVSKLRNHIVELTADANLDDSVTPSDAAMVQAPAVSRRLTASQIAAFLALHADEVADPGEMIMGTVTAVRDSRADAAANSETENGALITETAASASFLVCGADSAKAKALATQVAAWIKTAAGLNEKDFTAGAAGRDAALKKLLGDVDPMGVLSHWLDMQVAQLLSNPELPPAIDAILAAHPEAK